MLPNGEGDTSVLPGWVLVQGVTVVRPRADCQTVRSSPSIPDPTQRRVGDNQGNVWQLTWNLLLGTRPANASLIPPHEQEIKLKSTYCLVHFTVRLTCTLLSPLAFPQNLLPCPLGRHPSSYRKPCFCRHPNPHCQNCRELWKVSDFTLLSNKQARLTQFHGCWQKTQDF